ncbi:MAG: hypothetical protein RSB64_20525, partial [Pseudomonas sp.]
MSRTVANEMRTGTAQDVADMKLNGAQDINQSVFWPVTHPNGEIRFKLCTNSYTAIAGKPAPT